MTVIPGQEISGYFRLPYSWRLHNIMSRSIYLQVWSSFSMCDVILPHWESIRIMMAIFHKLLKLTMIENVTVLNTKCFSLSIKEILQHVRIGKPAGSMKWLAHLGREYRVQMVSVMGKHFYIYEPVQLRRANHPIVVPIFFYSHQDTIIYAKCVHPQIIKVDSKHSQTSNNQIPAHLDYHSSMVEDALVSDFGWSYSDVILPDGFKFIDSFGGHIAEMDGKDLSYIEVPNPWRKKGRGKLIYHMPLNLYADNTSGNNSKRWNKHISLYFTVSGLSPKMNNMEYAKVLEIAESIVEQLNDLATNGCIGYDPMIQQEVLIMSMPLCFMADSPMAAGVTNTPHPGRANNPCRICHLRNFLVFQHFLPKGNGPTQLSIHKRKGNQ
ncbi:hypothetical protein VP01_3699g1 [Puccinia sorghi]|uniref:Uncharacterized protein n=1 Tax=Puccinia sorghi TaxID=27349 RepID=A0A0L6UU78_9BASI|nr:hypothetical protein VP01_3699g1 [Puccinia sorghi]